MTISGKTFLEKLEQDKTKLLANTPDQTIKVPSGVTIKQEPAPSELTVPTQRQINESELQMRNYRNQSETDQGGNYLKNAAQTFSDIAGEIKTRIFTANTSTWQEQIEAAEPQYYANKAETIKTVTPIIDKDKQTQGLIESAKTGKTNMFANAYKDASEYGAGSAINTVFPNQWVDMNESTVYYANSKTTVSKPVLKNTLTFQNSKMLDIYNSITYNFQQNGDVYTVEEIKEYNPDWQNVPDDVVQKFIWDALSDVQTGERRSIDMYAEYYPALANGDNYINQKDSLIQLLTDENFINLGLGEFLSYTNEAGEWIAPEKLVDGRIAGDELLELVDAARTIKAGAILLNESGANITQATDYAIVKSYADQYPELKKALDTFDRLNLTIEDFDTIVENYNTNMRQIWSSYNYYGGEKGQTISEINHKIEQLAHQNLNEFNERYLNNWNKERLQGKFWYAGEGKIDSYILGLANSYRADDGKWYDKDGNEVEATDVRKGIIGNYLNILSSVPETLTELEYDVQASVDDPSRESIVNVIGDNVTLYFDAWNFTRGGFGFNLKTQIPYVGPIYEQLIGGVNEVSGELILGLANMTLFVDGEWTEESQQKFKSAAGGLMSIYVLGAIERTKGHLKEQLKNEYVQSAFKKAIDSYTNELVKGLEIIDVEAEKEKIIKQNQPEPVEGENEQGVKQTEQTRKVQRIVFIRGLFDRALRSFNQTFEEELQKNAGEGQKPTIVDTLWNLATRLANRKGGKTTDQILDEGIEKVENQKKANENRISELENRRTELLNKERTPEEKAELDRINKEIEQIKAENDSLTKKQDTTKESQSQEYRDNKAELEQKRTDLQSAQQQREQLREQLSTTNNEIITAKGEGNSELVKELREQNKQTKKQIEDVDRTIKNLERNIRTLEGNGTFRDMIDDIKEGARDAYQETKDEFRREETEITTPESPEVKVEGTETGTPEKAEGVTNVEEKAPEENRTVINQILDVIQRIQDSAREMYDKFNKGKEQKDLEKQMNEFDELEENMTWGDKTFTPEEFRTVADNPFTDSIMRIVNRITSARFNKKGEPEKVIQEDSPKNDEIQREVLSDGITKIQQYVDKIMSLRKKIGELYNKLSDEKTIRPRDFINGEEFKQLLSEYGLEYVEWIDEKGNPQRAVVADDGRVLNPKERQVASYMEKMVDIITEKSRISERDAHSTRQNFTSPGDWDAKRDFPKAVKRQLYNAWNKFLDRNGRSEMMRKLDEGFSQLSENLDTMSKLLSKDNTMKDNAKNEIFEWDEETIAQMNKLFPGIDKLIDLAKKSPSIVNKTVAAKLKNKKMRDFFGKRGRYGAVIVGSAVAGYVGGPLLIKAALGSLGFVSLEVLGNAVKKKISKDVPDREEYNKIIELLKVDDNKKTDLKKRLRATYETLSELADLKTETQMQAIMDEATQILIDRQAAKIRARKAFEQANEERKAAIEDQQSQTNSELGDLTRSIEWTNKQKPVNNGLPAPTPDTVGPDGTVTLGRGNPISPEQATKKPNPRKPIKEVKETYADKEKTQQGYTKEEEITMQASLGGEKDQTYSPEAEKVADVIEKTVEATADVIEEDAANKVMEKGEEPTPENIAKEMNKEPSSIEDFIKDMNETAPEEKTNYDGADVKDLEEVVAHPEKYPNVNIDAAKSALEKARRQDREASVMQSPDQQQAQEEIAGVNKSREMELEHNGKREKKREDMVTDTNRDPDALQTTEEYDRIYDQLNPEKAAKADKYSKGYKGFYRSDKDQTDKLRADMGKKPSQNITYTSSVDKIQTLQNPTSRKRVAQQRIDQKVDPNIKNAKTDKTRQKWEEEKNQLNQIIEQANVQIQAKEELKAQKTKLANKYKALEKKRSETPYPETKKELTKEMDKVSEEFDKIEMEEWEAEREVAKMEYEENMEIEKDVSEIENETPQKEDAELNEDPFMIEFNTEKKTAEELDQNETPQTDEISQEVSSEKVAEGKKETKTEQVSIDDIEYNKSTNPDTVELEVYKGVRGYGIEDTPGDPNTTFYTNDKSRADQYSKKPDAEKQTISLDKSKVKIIDSRGIKRNQKVDKNGNNIKGQTSKKGSDNYIDYNNRKATEEGYDAVIYRGITDIGPYVHKGAKIAESADDIVLLKKEAPKKETPKTEETKKPEPEPTSNPGGTPLVDVAKDGTVNKEPNVTDYTSKEIQDRIDYLKKKRADNGKKLFAQDLAELRTLQDLLKRRTERENRVQGTEATEADLDRRENLAPGMGGIQQSGKGVSED